MGKEYVYNDFIWKNIHGNINTNRIYPHFNRGNHFKKEFNSVTSSTVSLANYTIKNTETKLFLSIRDNVDYFEFNSNWVATKMKGAFLETIFDEIVNQNKTENKYINWRGNLFDYLLYLKGITTDLTLLKTSDFQIIVSFKAPLKLLQAGFENIELVDTSFIIALNNKTPNEIYKIGLNFLDLDNKKCIAILKIIFETHPFVGIAIGMAYFNLDENKLSNEYIVTGLNQRNYLDFSDDFIGVLCEVIATNELNLGISNDRTIRMLFKTLNSNQSPSALIKLSYIILSKNIKYLNEFALENIAIATEYNFNDKNEFTKIAGFHIICSVLLWNNKFEEAENYHTYFLEETTTFYKNYKDLVEGYIILALAKNNINFISNLILDFPHLKKFFSSLFEAWEFQNDESKKDFWNSLNFNYHKKINNAKSQYCN